MPIPLAVLNEYVQCIERQKADFWNQLEILMAGRMHIGERKFGRPIWTDTTHREISRLKKMIAEYETILARIKHEKYRYEPAPRVRAL